METKNKIIAVVLCGGSGNRLWPLSTVNLSKPFIPLPSGETLLEKTYRRALQIEGLEMVITVTNRRYKNQCKNEFNKLDSQIENLLLLETEVRNTAPAVLLAALAAKNRTDDEKVLLIMPSDHLIEEENLFLDCVRTALKSAEQNRLVTFGMETSGPETAYGYLHAGQESASGVFDIQDFVEKPDEKTAQKYHENPNYFCNSGIFCFRIKILLKEFETISPEFYNLGLKTWNLTAGSLSVLSLNIDFFSQMQKISFDCAIMEKTKIATMVKANFHWKDVGSWTGYAELLKIDPMKNSVLDESDIYMKDVRNNILFFSNPHRKVALIGLENLVVIETEEGLLIADKEKIQDVKDAANYFIDNKKS